MNRLTSHTLSPASPAPRPTRWPCRRARFTALVLAGLAAVATAFGAAPLKPRQAITKPARTVVDRSQHETNRIYVKFRDDLPVRLRNGKLTDAGAGELRPAAALLNRLEASGVAWGRQHRLSEEKLSELRATAQKNTGKAMPDLNTAYVVHLPEGLAADQVLNDFNALEEVEIALPMPQPSPPPVVPNYEPMQGYLDPATGGIDAEYAWTQPGGTGEDVWIADIEYNWNLNHADIEATLIGPAPTDGDGDHGTAVLGEMGGRNNGFGVTGIAHGSTFFVVAKRTANGDNPAAAITTAAAALRPGDIIVLEMQTFGPGATKDDDRYVPIEWWQPAYDAIRTAVGIGIIVVEAAGNGNQNLDEPMFNTGHKPFLAENDSGAIIVGAGAPPGHANGDRSRLDFSSYGSTVDLQGWGAGVVTTGYGSQYSADGTNYFYTAGFNGTSSATPIVAGACAAIQGAYKARYRGDVLSPANIREILQTTGSPQQGGTHPATENIGPRPNLVAAMRLVLPDEVWVDFAYAGAENGTFARPFNTLPEGVAVVPDRGSVMIKAGQTSWSGTLSSLRKTFSLRAADRPVTIGR